MSTDTSWYPSRWGADDVIGAMNLLTPEIRLKALSLVKQGRVYEMSRVLEDGIPIPGFHGQYFCNTHFTLESSKEWHDKNVGNITNGYSAQNTRLSMSDQTGTHIDNLNHVGVMQDNGEFLVYNGTRNSDIISSFGTKRLGIETMPPLISRGILADVASLKQIDMLPIGYAISPAELDDALAIVGVQPREGDTVFVHTGWGKNWSDPEKLMKGEPGLGKACARWAVDHDIVCWGLDQFAVDPLPFETEGEALPMHIEMLVKQGIRLIENVFMDDLIKEHVYEFCFIALPLKIRGATGSPLRAIAMI